jgi:hypothetical protein
VTAVALGFAPATAQAVPFATWTCNGSPCVGWFNRDVRLVWDIKVGQVVGPTCVNSVIVNDTPGLQRSCVLKDDEGEVPFTATIRLDKTPPVVIDAVPDRPPDFAGWYTRPVTFAPQGNDALSGLEQCDTPGYGGPDALNATIVATCRDVAGNATSRLFALRYDATPPDLTTAGITAADRIVRVSWPAGGTATVVRTPGVDGAPSTVLYEGPGTGFIDRRVRNRRQYHYALTLADPAGNAASRDLTAIPGRRLLTPDARALLNTPPLLSWTPVRGARYYNVQLFRRGRKILSAWPHRSQFKLRTTWRYHGRRIRLVDGIYHWYVWPGFGPRSEQRYGQRIGARTFVISRP